MAKKIFLLIAALILFSCAQVVRTPIQLDQQTFNNNYGRMFTAAISKGTEMSYTIDYQNKEYGLLKMSRKEGHGVYRIVVDFGNDNFTVQGGSDTDLFNPDIDKETKAIERAIRDAAR